MFERILNLFGKPDSSRGEISAAEAAELMTTTIAHPNQPKPRKSRPAPRATTAPDARTSELLNTLRAHHPRVAEAIAASWGTHACEAYLASLFFDDRSASAKHQYKARAGFSLEMMAVIVQLQDEHTERFGKKTRPTPDFVMPGTFR
jgi:hypothetical protein